MSELKPEDKPKDVAGAATPTPVSDATSPSPENVTPSKVIPENPPTSCHETSEKAPPSGGEVALEPAPLDLASTATNYENTGEGVSKVDGKDAVTPPATSLSLASNAASSLDVPVVSAAAATAPDVSSQTPPPIPSSAKLMPAGSDGVAKMNPPAASTSVGEGPVNLTAASSVSSRVRSASPSAQTAQALVALSQQATATEPPPLVVKPPGVPLTLTQDPPKPGESVNRGFGTQPAPGKTPLPSPTVVTSAQKMKSPSPAPPKGGPLVSTNLPAAAILTKPMDKSAIITSLPKSSANMPSQQVGKVEESSTHF